MFSEYPKFSKYFRRNNLEEITRDPGYVCHLIEAEKVDSSTVKNFLLLKCVSRSGFFNGFSVGSRLYHSHAHLNKILSHLNDLDKSEVLTVLLLEDPKNFFSSVNVGCIEQIFNAIIPGSYEDLIRILSSRRENESPEDKLIIDELIEGAQLVIDTIKLEQKETAKKLEEKKVTDGKLRKLHELQEAYNAKRHTFEQILGSEELIEECATVTVKCRNRIDVTQGINYQSRKKESLMQDFLDPKYNDKKQIKTFINHLTTKSKVEMLRRQLVFLFILEQDVDTINLMLSGLSLSDIKFILDNETMDCCGGGPVFKFRALPDSYTKNKEVISVIERVEKNLKEDEIVTEKHLETGLYQTSSKFSNAKKQPLDEQRGNRVSEVGEESDRNDLEFSNYLQSNHVNLEEITRNLDHVCHLIEVEKVDSSTVKNFLLLKCDSGAGFINRCSVGSRLYHSHAHFNKILGHLNDLDKSEVLTVLLHENPINFFSSVNVGYIEQICYAISPESCEDLIKILGSRREQESLEAKRIIDELIEGAQLVIDTIKLEQKETAKKLEEKKVTDGKLRKLHKLQEAYNAKRHTFEQILGSEELIEECATVTVKCRNRIDVTQGIGRNYQSRKKESLMQDFLDPKYNDKKQIKTFINHLTTKSKVEMLRRQLVFLFILEQDVDTINLMLSGLSLSDIKFILDNETMDCCGGGPVFKFRALPDSYTKNKEVISVIERVEKNLKEDEIVTEKHLETDRGSLLSRVIA